MNVNDLKNLYEKNHAEWSEINIFGIRNECNDESDLFNDQIGISTDKEIYLFQGTTDPGTWYTMHPTTYEGVTGAAHLVEGFHPFIWRVGLHAKGTNFEHTALIQTGNKVKFWRDVDKDMKKDSTDPIQTGYIGLNCHRAGLDDPLKIGKYGAGCQVVRNHQEFMLLMSIVLKSKLYLKDRGFARFGYLLVNKKNL